MDKYIENINSVLIQNSLPATSEISEKTLKRIIEFEKFARKLELRNENAIEEIKKSKMTKLSVSKSDGINISRKTLYNDKILMKYVEYRIEKQPDYFNLQKIAKLQFQNKELKKQYEKITEHLLDISILQAELFQHKEKIEELIEDKNRLYKALQENNLF